MIYSRFGEEVTLVRPVTTMAEVQKLDKRSSDLHDVQRIEYGMYVVGILKGDDVERLFDLGMLRADGGIQEINEAARAVGGNPK